MITTINLLIVGVSLFSYFIYTAPESCPEEYMTLRKDGGKLTNLGEIYKYCTPFDRNFKTWHLKPDTVTFDEILTKEPNND
jgi:tRNA(His) 5'-end guanylyltransferase